MKCCTRVPVGGTLELLSRVVGWNDVAILPTDIATVTCSVYLIRPATGEAVEVDSHVGISVTPADCIAATLQVNSKWTKDTIGYNFHHVPSLDAGSFLTQRNESYQVKYVLTPVDSDLEPIVLVFPVETY